MNCVASKLNEMLWPSNHHRHTAEFAVTSIDPVRHLLFYGPPGTGKTSGMTAVAVEAMRFCGVSASNLRELTSTGDVLLVDDEYGYGIETLQSLSEWSRRYSLNGLSRKIIIADEFDNYHATTWSKWKLMLDRFSKLNVQVLAATNHLSKIDTAVVDRFEQLHMSLDGRAGREELRDWLQLQIRQRKLTEMSPVQIGNILNRAGGSIRRLVAEIDRWQFDQRSE